MKRRFLSPCLAPILALAIALGTGAAAAECLSPRRALPFAGDQPRVPLASAMREARRALPGEVIAARVCGEGARATYELTVLGHDGKVSRAVIDAGSGAMMGVR